MPAAESERVPQFGVLGALRGGAAQASGLFERARGIKIAHVVIAAGALLGLFVAYLVVSHHSGPSPASPVVALARPSPPPPVIAAPVPVSPPPVAGEKEGPAAAGEEASAADKENSGRSGGDDDAAPRAKIAAHAGPSAAETKHLLDDGQRMLRAERFPEAREIFEKVAKGKSKLDRGSALVGLAEISFQEKNYIEAVRSATLAVDHGGGVKARVLLGDAHFRLAHYKEAAKAYGDALKLEPSNASAQSGLALATKRM
jgi:tetratricopeptide (TPR) repeat protein